MDISSPAFSPGAAIPAKYTCKGADTQPPLVFHDVPRAAKALAVVVDDPDAPVGLWTHWTVWDLAPTMPGIAEGAGVVGHGVEGTTTAKTIGWHGPCPPSGTHRYFFRLYALNQQLGLPRGSSLDAVKSAVKAHTIAAAELMGTFTR
jgi:hypothetical protein